MAYDDEQDYVPVAPLRGTPPLEMPAPGTLGAPSYAAAAPPTLGGPTLGNPSFPVPNTASGYTPVRPKQTLTYPNHSDYQAPPISLGRRIGGALAVGAGAFKSPELGEQIRHEVFDAPQEREDKKFQSAVGDWTRQSAQENEAQKQDLAEREAVPRGALEETEAEKMRMDMGLPKPVTQDKSIFTGPNNEKLTVDAYEIGGKRVYSVTGAGAPTANSPTTAEGALQEYLGKKAAPPAAVAPTLGGPTLGVPQTAPGGYTPVRPNQPALSSLNTAPPVPTSAPDVMKGWTAGEPAPEQRPASSQQIEDMRGVINASPIAGSEKAALLNELRTGMTTKELDTLSGRYENAAGRVSNADIANKNRVTAADVANKNREAAHTEAESEKEAIRNQDPVFAFDPKTKTRVYTTRGEAKSTGLTGIGKPVTEAEISKEEATTRQFNDVQMNVSRYKAALDAIPTDIPKDHVERMTQIISILPTLEKTGGDGIISQLTAGILPTVTSQAQQGDMARAWNYLTPQEQELMTGYFRARGSLLAYQRALTGSGRSSQLGLQLEMPNLPEPYVGATVADRRMKAFQENIDTASKGLVRFPWLDTAEDIRNNIERTPKGGNAPQGKPGDPLGIL